MGRFWVTLAMLPIALEILPASRARRGFVLAMCVLSAMLAATALTGWAFDRVELARWVVELPAMKANTALSVLSIAVALGRAGVALGRRMRRLLALAPLLAVGLMGATLTQAVTGIDLGIDQWALRDLATPAEAFPGRTAPAAALALLLLAVAALPSAREWRLARALAGIVSFAIGYVASVGLLLEVRWGSGIGTAFASLSLPTAACIVMLSASALSLVHWRATQGAELVASAGGRFLRSALPVAMVLPATVMWLQHLANVRGWWDASVGMVAAVALSALALWMLVWRSARWIDALEIELRKSHRLLEQRVTERTAELMDSAARLRASEAQLAGVVSTASTAIITLDANHRVIVFNHEAERVFGVSEREMLGQPLDRLLPEASREAHAGALQRFASTGSTQRRMGGEAQLHGLRANGQQFPIAASISRVAQSQGSLFTVVLRDLTDALALENERTARLAAEMASRSKSQLLSNVSHELRTPLSAVLGFAQLMRQQIEHQPDNAVRIDYLRHIESASRQLDRLIADLMDLSRAEIGAMSLALRPVDAAVVLRDAADMVAPQVTHHQLELLAPAHSGPAIVTADDKRLLQVVINLLSNAIKYTAPGGQVRLALRASDAGFAVDVVDTGQGMTAEQQAHLFEPFNRLGREHGSVQGSGIGLALSRQLVLAMGGRIEVASTPGQGSRFSVWLPGAERDAPASHYPVE
jgi:PAS domain S-box-containing protein